MRSVHKILAHSYSVFFIFFLVGVILDLDYKIGIFKNPIVAYWGFILIVLATALIFWAQKTSRNLDKKDLSKATFLKGPYIYSRSPTHWGLFLLMLGYGMVTNGFFVIILSLIALFLTKTVFLAQEEKILEEKYGASYREYKRAVKL